MAVVILWLYPCGENNKFTCSPSHSSTGANVISIYTVLCLFPIFHLMILHVAIHCVQVIKSIV